jgi:RNA polymerase sigma-70 factor, ECF subfamily
MTRPLSDPATWLDRHGDVLYRFALLRVRIPAVAEDLVQETLLAALRAREHFAGQAAEQTWLIAILKNKIVDHFRRGTREAALPEGDDPDAVIDALFNAADHWAQPAARWGEPEATLEQTEFWRVLRDCLAGLPPRQAQAFALTEFDGLDTASLCKVLGASTSNVWVLLHRARLRLRECLDDNWFGGAVAEKD